jgi:hypothetical protein
MIAAFNLASVLGIASLGQLHAAESFGTYVANGIFWSSVGAVGQVDSTSAAIARTSKAMITMGAPGTLVIRYSVPPSAELATATGALHLMANLVDPGVGASVDVSLLEVPMDDPGVSVASPSARSIVHLTSPDADGLTGFTTRCVAGPAQTTFSGFAFAKNVYYIQAVLSWDGLQPRAPVLRALKIGISGDDLCK